MKPYHEEKGIKIFHGDCREVLPTLEDKSVDLVLTDPPYGIGFNYGTGFKDAENGYIEWLWPVCETAEIKLKPSGYFLIFQAAKNARQYAEWFPRPWRLIALPKLFVQIRPTDLQWATDYGLLWQQEGDRKRIPKESQPNAARDWFLSKTTLQGRGTLLSGHPCPRPIDTIRYLVQCLSPLDGAVLDPFMGAGTSLLAAKILGRTATGIEIEERYCEIAARRLSQEVLPLTA